MVMRREEIFERVKMMLELVTDEEILEDSELIEDIGVSSMDILTVMSYIEAEFKVKIDVSKMCKMATVSDIVDFIMDAC